MESLSRPQLVAKAKEAGIKGAAAMKKADLVAALTTNTIEPPITIRRVRPEPQQSEIVCADCLVHLKTLPADSAQIVIADPPYNIGKDFGNDSDKQPLPEYLTWCDAWITECLRVLKPGGSFYIYGFMETLALISARLPQEQQRRFLIWHYTNKTVPSLNFWQRSYESILLLWKGDKPHFNRDAVREDYTNGFLNGAAGRKRAATAGRFSKGDKETTYTAHEGGALPRDVIKIPALAGGAGAKERVDHPTQKPLALCERLINAAATPACLVVVPFAGSGSECVAAQRLGHRFLGIELNDTYVQLTRDRLQSSQNA
jgi:site-specific DNA-methyltransferase (adenine-specific)